MEDTTWLTTSYDSIKFNIAYALHSCILIGRNLFLYKLIKSFCTDDTCLMENLFKLPSSGILLIILSNYIFDDNFDEY